MVQDISSNIALINESIQWADKYGKDAFPREVLKNYRRELKKIRESLSENCSAAAYGESQVGKSYLMSSLLSSPQHPFVIENKGKFYSFIDALNPSGGNNTKKESTGVITRFTIRQDNPKMKDYVKVKLLSVVDIILLLTDSYYNDLKISPESVLKYDDINRLLQERAELWHDKSVHQNIISEDDIRDIYDYVKDVIGNNAINVCQSNFCKVVSPVIEFIPEDRWVDIFGLLWNNNPEINHLFSLLINEYKKLRFQSDIYIPFDAVLREKGTLLKIEWLDTVCGIYKGDGKEDPYSDVYDTDGNLITTNFSKGYLSALISEITFVLPESIAEERRFLQKMDLLDFPGARSREKYKELEIKAVLPQILRRGKVAYLFNKYSRSLKITAVLFCHHNDMKTEPTIGATIHNWIEDNIGNSPEARAKMLQKTNGIAPLFMIGTKFNIELEKTKNDSPDQPEKLDSHWDRFKTTIPEIIKPERWMDDWVTKGGAFASPAFQNIYLLRDFYWSGKNQVFDGYNDRTNEPETGVHEYKDFPGFLEALKKSFIRNAFVQKHFSNPEQSWDDVATINNDGSKAIIRNLDAISGVLEDARSSKYLARLSEIQSELISRLELHHESKDKEVNNRKVLTIAGDIKLALALMVGTAPEKFGRIIDHLMIPSGDLRDIAYDILVRHIDEPKDVSAIKLIRAECGIVPNAEKSVNIEKLCRHYNKDVSALDEAFKREGFSVDMVLDDSSSVLATTSDVITKHIVDYWNDHLNMQVNELSTTLPHADEVAFMLMALLERLGVKKVISERINRYSSTFDPAELPNAIADFAALTLNNFVSTAGREYMSNEDLEIIRKKAESCSIDVDLSDDGCNAIAKPQPLMDVLIALDESGTLINQERIDMATLRKLPFWDNYQRWENLVVIGLLYSSDISHVDPVANAEIQSIIEKCTNLYK